MVRSLGIAEIGGAAGEGVGSNGNPVGADEVSAGLDHDNGATGAPELLRNTVPGVPVTRAAGNKDVVAESRMWVWPVTLAPKRSAGGSGDWHAHGESVGPVSHKTR